MANQLTGVLAGAPAGPKAWLVRRTRVLSDPARQLVVGTSHRGLDRCRQNVQHFAHVMLSMLNMLITAFSVEKEHLRKSGCGRELRFRPRTRS